MNTDATDAIIESLNQATNILVLLPPSPNGDQVGAALALRMFLRKSDKEVSVVCPNKPDLKYSFIEGFDHIENKISLTRNFVIEVSNKNVAVEELSYKKDNDKLLIFLKPKEGQFTEEDVTFNAGSFPFNMVFTIGISSLDQLGEFYSSNPELFFNSTIVNIDHKPGNESFAQINLIDIASSSCSEMVMDLIIKAEASHLDESIATAILSGIISNTNSFQHTRTNPSTFYKASQLVGMGAKQQDIINQLYKTKSINFLRLWGRGLARLKQDVGIGLAYTSLTLSDMEKSQASYDDVLKVPQELSIQIRQAKSIIIFQEITPENTRVLVLFPPTMSPDGIFGSFGGHFVGSNMFVFETNLPLISSEAEIIGLIKTHFEPFAQP